MQWFGLDYATSDFSWIQTKDSQTTSDGLVKYSFLDQTNMGTWADLVVESFNSMVEEKLLLPHNSVGFWYFQELLDTLSYERSRNNGSNVFLLPAHVITYIDIQVRNLNVFECKNLLIQIDKIIKWLHDATYLISSYNHIRSAIFKRFEELVKTPSIPNNNPEETVDIVYLWELLQWPVERTRFIPTENQNPAFTQKINDYRDRVQHGIRNFTDTSFSLTFDMIFKICSTILQSRDIPDFPRDEIIQWIDQFSLFECQYMLDWVNATIYPESQTNLVPRMDYVHLIKWFLERRIADIQWIEK